MKKLLILIAFVSNIQLVLANTYIEKTIEWHKVRIIEQNLNSDIYDIKISKSDSEDNLKNILSKDNSITWINWVFFCPKDYTECWDKSFTNNERYIKWEKYSTWNDTWDRVVFWWTEEKNPMLFQTDKINENNEEDIYYWFWNHPLLLKDWIPQTEKYRELGLMDNKMKTNSIRNFICSDKDNKYIKFWLVYNINLDNLALLLIKLWCYNALNLDAWYSTAFMYNNRYIYWPWRDILDSISIERKWLNRQKNIDYADKISKQIIEYIFKKDNIDSKILYTEKLIEKLIEIRVNIYKKYNTDILDSNWINIWYKLEINDLKSLKQIIVINQIKYNLEKLNSEILKEFKKINNENFLDINFKLDYDFKK